MPSLPILKMVTPIIFPTVAALGFNLIWFGVMVVILTEMGVITPPVGANVYAISGVAKYVPMETIFKGIMPFVVVMIIAMIILMVFPQIALFLPNLMR